MSSPAEKALELIKYLPRVSLNNLVRNPYAPKKKVSEFFKKWTILASLMEI